MDLGVLVLLIVRIFNLSKLVQVKRRAHIVEIVEIFKVIAMCLPHNQFA